MKNIQKKRLAILLSFALIVIFIFTSTVYAKQVAPDEENNPTYHTVCGNLPYHVMYPNCTCTCYYNGSAYIYGAKLWQCVNCHQLLATEGDYYFGTMEPIGKWGSCAWYEPVGMSFSVMNASLTGYTNNNYLGGYQFNLYP